jgi:hypothetical protein
MAEAIRRPTRGGKASIPNKRESEVPTVKEMLSRSRGLPHLIHRRFHAARRAAGLSRASRDLAAADDAAGASCFGM